MVVGFVNSNLMNLYQAVGVIMGANIGTTVTAWLLSLTGLQGDSFLIQMLSPNAWSPLLGFAGIALFMFGKDRKKGVGQIFLGFADPHGGHGPDVRRDRPAGRRPLVRAVVPGVPEPGARRHRRRAVLTGIIQSSSASVGILQALSTSTGAVSCAAAMPIIMGQNIGTCVTALLSSAGANKNARRTAMIHLYFNIIGTVVFLSGFYALNAVFRFPFYHAQANAFNIAVIHTVFNVVTTAILLPFNKLLVRLAILTVPDAKDAQPSTGRHPGRAPAQHPGRRGSSAPALSAATWPRSAAPRCCRRCPPPPPLGRTPLWTRSSARRTPRTTMRTCWAATWSSCRGMSFRPPTTAPSTRCCTPSATLSASPTTRST